MATELTFYKMSGSGNDFVVLDGRLSPPEAWTPRAVAALCDRRQGIGADGLVVLSPAPEGEGQVRMDFWNCDGSPAAMCGNAALCSTRLAVYLSLAQPEGMWLQTEAGTFLTRCLPGPGELAELNLPDVVLPGDPPPIAAPGVAAAATLLTVGVPHLVVEVPDLEAPGLMERGAVLRHDSGSGPAGANVNFVGQDGPAGAWRLRTYERGVEGETLACGTGAVAAALALAWSGKAVLPLELVSRSGRSLHIRATLSERSATGVWLRGEGRMVFKGAMSAPARLR